MKCPYNVKIEQVIQWRREYDDDGREFLTESRLMEKRPFVDCLEDECGAWQGGRCRYRGGD